MKDIDIRYTEMSDQPSLIEWLKDPDALRWFPMQEKEVEDSGANWIGFSRWRSSLTAMIDKKPVAIGTIFLMPYRKMIHLATFYLIVDKKFRRMGIGNEMMRNLLNLGKKYFHLESMYAEIYENCPILSVLEKNDFKVFAIQEHYVKEKNGYLSRILLERDL
ncbi:MAG: GNAT family N-acetyltransferase [Chlamydiae bacterium]|nr:GNAT family N-acetyltransferase [Chlamydiota bacterium]